MRPDSTWPFPSSLYRSRQQKTNSNDQSSTTQLMEAVARETTLTSPDSAISANEQLQSSSLTVESVESPQTGLNTSKVSGGF